MTQAGRYLVLAAAFLGWMFAGWEMSLLPLAARSATIGMLQEAPEEAEWVTLARTPSDRETDIAGSAEAVAAAGKRLENEVGRWFARYIAAFLLGAAAGGLIFGWCGDRFGRARSMAASILWYAVFTGLAYFVSTPWQMTVMRFVACMGIGGMWPNGVALVSEAWSDVSRPTLAGLIGTSANVGIALLGITVKIIGEISSEFELTPDSWRWMMLLGAVPAFLGLAVFAMVPESPQWLSHASTASQRKTPVAEVFQPPLLKLTLVGILLGTIPLVGAWGAQKWILPWAGQIGAAMGQPSLKADTQTIWAIGAAIGSLCGGWIAHVVGRRRSYFIVSLGAVLLSGFIFRVLDPAMGWRFMGSVFLLGLISTVYFGWLPLFLPELFPTHVRATGAGVSFNFGRIISAGLVLSTVALVTRYNGDYSRIGATTSLVYAAGMVVIFLAPRHARAVGKTD